jgi:hypothetical protein
MSKWKILVTVQRRMTWDNGHEWLSKDFKRRGFDQFQVNCHSTMTEILRKITKAPSKDSR